MIIFFFKNKIWVNFCIFFSPPKRPHNMNKVSLQISLERNFSNLLYISFFSVNFKNLINESHVPCVLNIHIKFHLNQMLFTIRSINLFFIYNFRSQKCEILTFS